MDDKTLTAVSTSLALMQIQVNALLLLLERHNPDAPIKEDFHRLIGEGVHSRTRNDAEHQKPDSRRDYSGGN